MTFSGIDMAELTPQQMKAVTLVASGRMTMTTVARKLDITTRTLENWRKIPAFAAELEQAIAERIQDIKDHAIAQRAARVGRQSRDWQRMQDLIDARAEDPSMQGIPGGETGLLVRTIKGIGTGENFSQIEEYEFDAALVKELRELEKLTAIELGQLIHKTDVTSNSTSLIEMIEVVVPPDSETPEADGDNTEAP